MTSSEVWDENTARRYDTDSAEMFATDVLDPAVGFLADLAGSGPALEFAIGTGRVAIPLAARGVPVSGIELSEPMLEQLRRKTELPAVQGDMATTRVPGEFTLVYLVWNSISNLTYDLATQACTSHHYWHDPDGTTRYSAGNFRYIWPAECDLMARLAGLELEDRFAGWDRSPFTSESESHVSVWRKPADWQVDGVTGS